MSAVQQNKSQYSAMFVVFILLCVAIAVVFMFIGQQQLAGYLILGAGVISSLVVARAMFGRIRFELAQASALKRLARDNGLSYSVRVRNSQLEPMLSSQLWLPHANGSRTAAQRAAETANEVYGEYRQLTLSLFESYYRVSARRGQRLQMQSVLVFSLPDYAGPAFSLQPRTLQQQLAGEGEQHAFLQDHPVFQNRYCLQTEQLGAMQSLLSAALIDYLETLPELSLELLANGRLIIYRAGVRCPAEELDSWLEQGVTLAQKITLKESHDV